MARKLDDDITWHRDQIARINQAIDRRESGEEEPGQPAARGPAWGPKGETGALPQSIAGMRRLLDRYEQMLVALEDQRGLEG